MQNIGVHRGLDRKLTFVRSLTLDIINQDVIKQFKALGNILLWWLNATLLLDKVSDIKEVVVFSSIFYKIKIIINLINHVLISNHKCCCAFLS